MLKQIKTHLRQLPLALNGLALSLLTLSHFLQILQLQIISNIFYYLSLIMIMLTIVKYITSINVLLNELNNYQLSAYLPLFSMYLATLAHDLAYTCQLLAEIVWYFAGALHLGLLSHLLIYHASQKSLDKILPSLFIPPIGIIAIGLAAFSPNTIFISKYIFGFAESCFLPISGIIIWRQFTKPLNNEELTSMGIYAAPISLLILAYLSNPVLKIIPYYLETLILLNILCNCIAIAALYNTLKNLKFSAAFAAFTFSFAISALTFLKLLKYYQCLVILIWPNAIIAIIMTLILLWHILTTNLNQKADFK